MTEKRKPTQKRRADRETRRARARAVLLVVGFLFIFDFPMPKPGLKAIISFSVVLAVTVGIIFAYTTFRVPAPTDEDNPIVEEISEEITPLVEEFVEDIIEDLTEEEHAEPQAS